jgi:hypothetical protein
MAAPSLKIGKYMATIKPPTIVYYKAVMEMRDKVTTGESLQNAMAQTQMFPHMVVQMTWLLRFLQNGQWRIYAGVYR